MPKSTNKPTASQNRKAREREMRMELILENAKEILLKKGIQNLNMDELAEQIEYSKGILYQHFSSKEDIVLAVAADAMRVRAELFEKAIGFQGTTREKMRAISFACGHFALQYPSYYELETTIRSNSFWDRASEARQDAHKMQLGRCFKACATVVRLAVEAGDLPAYPRHCESPELVTTSLAAITLGSGIICNLRDIAFYAQSTDRVRMMRSHQELMLDGLGWLPAGRELDLDAIDKRIRVECFPDANWLK